MSDLRLKFIILSYDTVHEILFLSVCHCTTHFRKTLSLLSTKTGALSTFLLLFVVAAAQNKSVFRKIRLNEAVWTSLMAFALAEIRDALSWKDITAWFKNKSRSNSHYSLNNLIPHSLPAVEIVNDTQEEYSSLQDSPVTSVSSGISSMMHFSSCSPRSKYMPAANTR